MSGKMYNMKGAVALELIIAIVLVCCVFLVVMLINQVWDDVTAGDEIFTEHADIKAEGDQIFVIFGYLPILMFGGSLISMIVLSFFTESHPIFLGLSLIVFIISIPLMAILSNATMGIVVSDPGLASIAESHEESTQMIGNLVLFGTAAGLLVLAALYGKMSQR